MSNIEAMWTIRFGSPDAGPEMDLDGGILVVETGQVFGGDSGYAYTGTCELAGDTLTASLRIRRHRPNIRSYFGDLDDFSVAVRGTRVSETRFEGHINGGPAFFVMERFAELP